MLFLKLNSRYIIFCVFFLLFLSYVLYFGVSVEQKLNQLIITNENLSVKLNVLEKELNSIKVENLNLLQSNETLKLQVNNEIINNCTNLSNNFLSSHENFCNIISLELIFIVVGVCGLGYFYFPVNSSFLIKTFYAWNSASFQFLNSFFELSFLKEFEVSDQLKNVFKITLNQEQHVCNFLIKPFGESSFMPLDMYLIKQGQLISKLLSDNALLGGLELSETSLRQTSVLTIEEISNISQLVSSQLM